MNEPSDEMHEISGIKAAHSASATLQEMVVGQDTAKRQLTSLIEMHYSWFKSRQSLHRAPNALMIGPTGTGKSHAISALATNLTLPLVVVDSTRLVAAVATEQITFEQVILQLIQSARKLHPANPSIDEPPERIAERGIVFLDEFDKLRTTDMTSASAAIQRRLLQFIEGETIFLEHSERAATRYVNTHGILFIVAGAFSGIRSNRVVSERPQATSRTPEVGKTVQPQDVVAFGFLHELIARLPIIIRFDKLQQEDLALILDHSLVSPINFYHQYFGNRSYRLVIPSETKKLICEEAFRVGLGARSLHQTLFPILSALADELPRKDECAEPADYILTPERYGRLRIKAYR